MNLHAPLRIREFLMISHQMLLVPWILLHPLVILDISKHGLAKTVIIRDVGELGVEELSHEGTGGTCIVDLYIPVSLPVGTPGIFPRVDQLWEFSISKKTEIQATLT